MYNIALIAFDTVDQASQALADVEQNADTAKCTIQEYAVVRTDAQIAIVNTAAVDSDEDYDDMDGIVEAFVDAAADYCSAEDDGADEVVVAAADVFEASGAALAMLIDAPHQDDINALLAPYGDAVTTWDAADVRRALHEVRKLGREEDRAERKAAREEDRAERKEAREERREERQIERAERSAEREEEREMRKDF